MDKQRVSTTIAEAILHADSNSDRFERFSNAICAFR